MHHAYAIVVTQSLHTCIIRNNPNSPHDPIPTGTIDDFVSNILMRKKRVIDEIMLPPPEEREVHAPPGKREVAGSAGGAGAGAAGSSEMDTDVLRRIHHDAATSLLVCYLDTPLHTVVRLLVERRCACAPSACHRSVL